MLTLYGELVEDGDDWLFTPAQRLDHLAPDFGQPARLNKNDVRTGTGYGMDCVYLDASIAERAGLIQPPNLRASFYIV